MSNGAKIAVLAGAILIVHALASPPARSQVDGVIVELETPLASPHPLLGYLRRQDRAGPSPAVVLLHSCNGNWLRIDERWGKRIPSWGYVTLAVDSFGPRGIKSTCQDSTSIDFTGDAERALNFLAQQPSIDPARIAVVGFAWGGFSSLSAVERKHIEQETPNSFRAAVAFYPPCAKLRGDLTVPALILIGERDDQYPADDCRKMVSGRDSWGISREKNRSAPMQLIVYPDAYHAFDAPGLKTPLEISGHHLEFNEAATRQAAEALHAFLDATIGGKVQAK